MPPCTSDLYLQNLRRKYINIGICLTLSPNDLGINPHCMKWVGMPTLTLLQPRFFLLVCCSEAGRKSKQTSVKKKKIKFLLPHKFGVTMYINKRTHYINPLTICLYIYICGLSTRFYLRKSTIQSATYLFASKLTTINSYTNVSALCEGQTLDNETKSNSALSGKLFKLSLFLHPVSHNTSNSSCCKPYFALQ